MLFRSITWFGAMLISDNLLTLPVMMSFNMYAMQIIMSFMMLIMVFIFLPRASVSAKRICEVIDTPNSISTPQNPVEVEKCMHALRNFHEMNLSVDHCFDIFEQIIYYENIRNGPSMYADYEETKQKVFQLKNYIDSQNKV